MSRESRIIQVEAFQNSQDVISKYESFGWELLSINGSQLTMSRETQVDCYPELVKYQAQYEDKLKEYMAVIDPVRPNPISFGACFWLFILAIFPLAIYLTFKIKNKKAYEETISNNNALRAKLKADMDAIALESRGVFFSKRA